MQMDDGHFINIHNYRSGDCIFTSDEGVDGTLGRGGFSQQRARSPASSGGAAALRRTGLNAAASGCDGAPFLPAAQG